MNQLQKNTLIAARILISLVFLVNATGIIDQSEAVRELIERGVPQNIAPTLMLAGRSLEFVAGVGLALGFLPQLSALGLIVFLIPATLVGHPFWLVEGTPLFTPQLINFFKNIAIMGGLFFVASINVQPDLRKSIPSSSKR